MKKMIEVCTCDVCGAQPHLTQRVNFPVLFHTEQTEGRPVVPYISQQQLDLCDACVGKFLLIHGDGAQGHNSYYVE